MTLTDWIVAVVAVVALLISISTYYDTRRSADATVRSAEAADGSKIAADKSVTEARRSADASERSAALAETERNRTIERTDVTWHVLGRENSGVLKFKNGGLNTAHKVTAMIVVGDESFHFAFEDVQSGESFECDATHVFKAKAEANATTIKAFHGSGIAYFPSYDVPLTARISWQSELGTPGIQVIEHEAA